MSNFCTQLPATLDGVYNPFIGAATKKLEKYKIPYVMLSVYFEGREFIEIRATEGKAEKKPRGQAKAKLSTGITSEVLSDGSFLITHPSGRSSICSFPWEEKRYWSMMRATSARVDKAMRLGNYGFDCRGKLKKLPLKGEIFVGEVAA